MEKLIFVQRKGDNQLETVDEFPYNNREERKYAREMLREYQMSDPTATFYLSSRPCKAWTE